MNLEFLQLKEELIVSNKPSSEDFYICKICKNILVDPRSCSVCEDFFCLECLSEKLKNENECPFCRENPFYEGKYNKQLNYILNKIILKCPFNCKEIFSYEDLKSHIKDCSSAPKFYLCELCGERITIYDKTKEKDLLNEHGRLCPAVLKKCLHCNCEFQRHYLQSHMKHCEYKLFYCGICKMKFPAKFRHAHND